jgi:hypothetical protein
MAMPMNDETSGCCSTEKMLRILAESLEQASGSVLELGFTVRCGEREYLSAGEAIPGGEWLVALARLGGSYTEGSPDRD